MLVKPFTAVLALSIAGCTPAIKEQWQKELGAVQSYEYGVTVKEFFGIKPQRERYDDGTEINARNCVVEKSGERRITYTGVEDSHSYSKCVPVPYLNTPPQRLEGR